MSVELRKASQGISLLTMILQLLHADGPQVGVGHHVEGSHHQPGADRLDLQVQVGHLLVLLPPSNGYQHLGMCMMSQSVSGVTHTSQ